MSVSAMRHTCYTRSTEKELTIVYHTDNHNAADANILIAIAERKPLICAHANKEIT